MRNGLPLAVSYQNSLITIFSKDGYLIRHLLKPNYLYYFENRRKHKNVFKLIYIQYNKIKSSTLKCFAGKHNRKTIITQFKKIYWNYMCLILSYTLIIHLIITTKIMQELFEVFIAQFKTDTHYYRFIRKCITDFNIKVYKIHEYTLEKAMSMCRLFQEKYDNQKTQEYSRKWYEHERKLYVWFIICFMKLKPELLDDPLEFVNKRRYDGYWKQISLAFNQKDILFLKYQLLCILKTKERVDWELKEKEELKEAINLYEIGEWNQIAKYLYINSNGKYFRLSKQCKQRWQNHFQDIKKDGFTTSDDLKVFEFVKKNGKEDTEIKKNKKSKKISKIKNQWIEISKKLHKRTEHQVKNRYTAVLNRHMKKYQIDQFNNFNEEMQAISHIVKQLNQKLKQEKKKSRRQETFEQQILGQSEEMLIPQQLKQVDRNGQTHLNTFQQLPNNSSIREAEEFFEENRHRLSYLYRNSNGNFDYLGESGNCFPSFFKNNLNIGSLHHSLNKSLYKNNYN